MHELNKPIDIDYLVGGFRISVREDSNTPGPRTHILGFTSALDSLGHNPRLLLVSDLPLMGRFTRISQGDYKDISEWRVWAADAVRIAAALWSGLHMFTRTALRPAPDVIYERSAVLQSLTSFHAKKCRSIRIVEVNGILSRETSRDRKVLKSERLAAAIERHVMRSAQLIIVVSQNLADEVTEFANIAENKVLVVPNGINQTFKNVQRVASDGHVFGFVGSLAAWQHLDRLIRVFVEVSRSNPSEWLGTSLEIVGDGADKRRLSELISELGAQDIVRLTGRLSHEESMERVARWDVGIAGHERSSSKTMYHSPLKLYEYGALGLSIVCTPSADALRLSESGVPVFLYEDELSLREALHEALRLSKAREQADITLQRERVIEKHSWETRVESVLDAARKLRVKC